MYIYDWEEVIEEGSARIIIPRMEFYKRPDHVYEPAWSPVFYNPHMRISRDTTILVVKTIFSNRDFFFIDALAGTGVRGIRIALEIGGRGVLNDVDPIAYYYIRRNIEFNNVGDKLVAFHSEANGLFNYFTFTGIPVDYVDLDPYGSPIPFIDSAVKPLSKNAVIGVSATDTAPLTCSHKRKTLRRYNVNCVKTDFDKELGLRILIYNIVQRGASQDVCLQPVLSYYHRHHYRVFFTTIRSGVKSYEIIEQCRGYLWFCPTTLERGYVVNPVEVADLECLDRSKPVIIGPLWICNLGDIEFLYSIGKNIGEHSFIAPETLKTIRCLNGDYIVNEPYIRYDKLFKILRRNQPPIHEFINKIRETGFKAYRSHFDPRGVKTNASIRDLIEIYQ